MEMVKRMLICAGITAATAAGADFSLTIGSPFAAVAPGAKAPVVKKTAALFAVRLEECPTLDQVQIGGVAEGLVDGQRTSAPIAISAASPGVYVVSPTGTQTQGVWVVSLRASCGSAKAGALVPLSPQGFLRDQTRILPRPATKAEIDASLKTLASAHSEPRP